MSLFDEMHSLEDVDRLVDDKVRESATLDYKTADHAIRDEHHDDLAKDASAFANASGGVIVYGVKTGGEDKTAPTGRIAMDPKNVLRIRRAFASMIRHPIPGLRFKALPQTGTPEALLVDIPASPLAPHQVVKRCIYYRREDEESRPMAHDLVELYFGRRLGPLLVPAPGEIRNGTVGGSEFSILFDVDGRNDGARTAPHMVATVSGSQHVTVNSVLGADAGQALAGRTDVHKLRLPESVLIHPSDSATLLHMRVGIPVDQRHSDALTFEITLVAEDMRPMKWRGFLSAVGGREKFAIEFRSAEYEEA